MLQSDPSLLQKLGLEASYTEDQGCNGGGISYTAQLGKNQISFTSLVH